LSKPLEGDIGLNVYHEGEVAWTIKKITQSHHFYLVINFYRYS
jgi:hypothetical protein